MKPILCRVLSCQNGVLLLEDVNSKATIKKYTKKHYHTQTILVLLNEQILPYSYKTKKLLKQYRQQKQFEKLLEDVPNKQTYFDIVKNSSIGEFYDKIINSEQQNALKNKLLTYYTKKYKIIFKLDLTLYQKQCLDKLLELVEKYKDTVEYIGGTEFCITSKYNTLNEKPYHKFMKRYQQITEINAASIKVVL